MKRSFLGIARNFNQANTLVHRLRQVGFDTAEISMLAPEVGGESQIRGSLAHLAEASPLAFPGLGSWIAAGPIKAVLNDAGLEEEAGGLSGRLVIAGVPKSEAALYEEKLQQGNYLLCVSANENKDVERARETFRNSGAEDLCVTEEAAIPPLGKLPIA